MPYNHQQVIASEVSPIALSQPLLILDYYSLLTQPLHRKVFGRFSLAGECALVGLLITYFHTTVLNRIFSFRAERPLT